MFAIFGAIFKTYCKTMKNTIALFSFLSCLLINFCLISCSSASHNSGTVYYFDATGGNDDYNGTSETTAWKSLKNIKQLKLNAGDQLLFKRGEHFKGVIEVSAQGNFHAPVLIGAYGPAVEKPIISAPDSSLYTVRILNSDYVTLQDLELVNHGSTDLASRTGVKVESTNYGVSKGIRLNNLFIHDVNGTITKWDGGGSGILIVNGGKETISTFDSLTIEYCHIKNCQRNAMIWNGYSDRANWHPSTNVLVRYNLIEEVPGDGIVPIGCDGAIIEYNVMRRGLTSMLHSNREAAAGMWPWACDNTIIRFNESSDHKGTWDGQAFDADYNCKNTVIEYNYSHDNDGGLVLICSSGDEDRTSYCIGTENPIVRYNISIGDGNRPFMTRGKWFSPSIHIAGPVRGAQIYRNIVRNKEKAAPEIDRSMLISDDWTGFADNTLIKENIFYTPEISRFDLGKSTNNTLVGNYYLGRYSLLPQGEKTSKLTSDYMELLENEGGEGLKQLMDSVTIAGGAKCVFVNKQNIEAFFNKLIQEPRL